MRKLFTVVLLILLSIAGSVTTALAQFDTATVLGTVKDNTGGVVPGVTVTLTGLDTGITTTKVTDENGNFEFTTVRIGRYKVTAELTGFSIALADNVQVTVGARQRVDLQLTPGSMHGDRRSHRRRHPARDRHQRARADHHREQVVRCR